MSAREDPVRRALSGFSLRTLGDEQRWGNSIAIPGKEIERYEVGPASVVIANEGDVGRYTVIEPRSSASTHLLKFSPSPR